MIDGPMHWLDTSLLLSFSVFSHFGDLLALWVCASPARDRLLRDLGCHITDGGVWNGHCLGSVLLKNVLSREGDIVGISRPGVCPLPGVREFTLG